MPTKLTKPVSRTTLGEFFGSGRGQKRINIHLRPGDVICLSYSGSRTEYCVDIGAVMTWAQGRTAGVSIEPRKKRTNL